MLPPSSFEPQDPSLDPSGRTRARRARWPRTFALLTAVTVIAVLASLLSWGAAGTAPVIGADLGKAACARYDHGLGTGRCFRDPHGGVYWLGTMKGYDGVELYCIDYYYGTDWGVRHHRVTVRGPLTTSLGHKVDDNTVAALTEVVTKHRAGSVSANTAAAISLIIREVMGDVKQGGRSPIPGGLTVHGHVKNVGFVSRAVIARASALWNDAVAKRGPWTLRVALHPGPDGRVTPGERLSATVTARTGAGKPQEATVAMTYRGFTGARSVTLGRDGSGRVKLVASARPGVATASASIAHTPSPDPVIIRPRNWHTVTAGGHPVAVTQRGLVGMQATIRASGSARIPVVYNPRATTRTSAAETKPGASITDEVVITGANPASRGPITATLYGPFTSAPTSTSCDGAAPVAGRVTIPIHGNGTYTSPAVTIPRPGYYTWREDLPASSDMKALATPCGVPGETTRAKAHPVFQTQVSDQKVIPGAAVTDKITVGGLIPGLPLTVGWALYGPFRARPTASSCTGVPVASGSLTVMGNGTVTTPATRLTKPGLYTYTESSASTPLYEASSTRCGQVEETTTVAEVVPKIITKTSHQSITVGASIRDRVEVSGAAKGYHQIATARLFGPYASRAAATCTGTPYKAVHFPISGNGTFVTPSITIKAAGVYTWVESLPGDGVTAAATTRCGVIAETTIAERPPRVPPHPTVPAGGAAPAPLAGPIAWVGVPSPLTTLNQPAGGERSPGASAFSVPVTRKVAAERPGRIVGEVRPARPAVAGSSADARSLVRLTVPGVGIRAGVVPVGFVSGQLQIPPSLGRVGDWRGGARPGDAIGNLVVVGHVSDNSDRPGVMSKLRHVRPGQVVRLIARDGEVHRFVVTATRNYSKGRLPRAIFTQSGPMRLRLITCTHRVSYSGGHFHYTDNLVVTARPA